MSAGHFPFGIPAVKSRSARLPGAGVVSPSYEPYPRRSGTCAVRPSSAMILRSTFSETRVRSAALTLRYPYLPPGGGECLGRPDARPGISVNPEPGAVAVGSCLARRRASMLFLVKSVFRVSSLIFFGFRHEECRPVVCFTGCPSCRT